MEDAGQRRPGSGASAAGGGGRATARRRRVGGWAAPDELCCRSSEDERQRRAGSAARGEQGGGGGRRRTSSVARSSSLSSRPQPNPNLTTRSHHCPPHRNPDLRRGHRCPPHRDPALRRERRCPPHEPARPLSRDLGQVKSASAPTSLPRRPQAGSGGSAQSRRLQDAEAKGASCCLPSHAQRDLFLGTRVDLVSRSEYCL